MNTIHGFTYRLGWILSGYAFVSSSTADVKHIDSLQYTVLSVACAAETFCDVYSAETMLQSDGGLRNSLVFKLYALCKSKIWNKYSDKVRRYFIQNISSCIRVIIFTFYPCFLLENHVNYMYFHHTWCESRSLYYDVPMCRSITEFLDVCFTIILLYNNTIHRNHIVLINV